MTKLPCPLVLGLLDDAATFPPGNARMAEAVDARAMYAESWYAGLLGSFVVRADRVEELVAVLTATPDSWGPEPLDITVTVPTGPVGVAEAVRSAQHPALRLVSVEVPLGDTEPDTEVLVRTRHEVPGDLPLYVELARTVDPATAMPVLAEAQVRAKLRTGGTSAAGFPDEATVARFVHAAVNASVPFKATAGLHNAIRHRDPDTGFEHHGFLNLLAATTAVLLLPEVDREEIRLVVAERNPEPLIDLLLGLSREQAVAVRQAFTGFGTCSTIEPVEDLVGLGLLSREPVEVGG